MSLFRILLATFFLLLACAVVLVAGQECSATKLCATGCCSAFGFCGTDAAHCGTGCLSTCDYKVGCDENNPCKDGTCCSKFGFCGLGPDCEWTFDTLEAGVFERIWKLTSSPRPDCAKPGCRSNCDAKSYCNPGYGAQWSEIDECPLRACCSKWG